MEEEKNENNNSMMRYFSNPRAFTLKKWFSEILGHKYVNHEESIERIATSLISDKDVANFGKLVAALYEAGFFKAVEDYREELERLGISIKIQPPNS